MVDWLKTVGGEEVLHVSPDDRDFPDQPKAEEIGPDGKERLRAECCCGGVSFTIPRPSRDIIDAAYMSLSVSPADPRKWKAFLDVCRDCGRLSGAGAVPWMLVPRIAIEPALPPDLSSLGTLKTYRSSEPNTRAFCGVCGATVLISSKNRMPSEGEAVLNVAMGILRAPEGVRAEDWVTWRTGQIAWAEDARRYDGDFVDALVEGHEDWGKEKYGEILRFDVI